MQFLIVGLCFVSFQNVLGLSANISNYDLAIEESEAKKYLKEIENDYSLICHKQMVAQVEFAADANNLTGNARAEAVREYNDFEMKVKKYVKVVFPNWQLYKNEEVRYQLGNMQFFGLPTKKMVDKYIAIQNNILEKQAAARICDMDNQTNCDLKLVPDVINKLLSNPTVEESEYYIDELFTSFGSMVTPEMYAELVNISNEIALVEGYPDLVTAWLDSFGDHSGNWSVESFRGELVQLMDDFKPYFVKFHAYVRLIIQQRDEEAAAKITEDGLMPLSILNAVMGNDWSLIANKIIPIPNVAIITGADVTDAMKEAEFTPLRMVEAAENFFMSLDPEWKMPSVFWEKSLFQKPKDKQASCHPRAFDMCINGDVRLHQCIKITDAALKTLFHEMGHLVYYKSYSKLPYSLRFGANPGFHEAVGDTIALSLGPKHLKCHLNLSLANSNWINCNPDKIGREKYEITEVDINTLFIKALSKFGFFFDKLPNLPFAYAVSIWREKVFKGDMTPGEFNLGWWKTLEESSGIIPPKRRSPETLDLAYLYHILMNSNYIRYFISEILEFQFFEVLCITAREYNPEDERSVPLHHCDFGGSQEAGMKLKHMLSKGASQDWRTVLEEFTGSRVMTIRPLVRYFKPLFNFIDRELEKYNVTACFGANCNKK